MCDWRVLGLVIGTALGWDDVPTIVLAIVLAFVFGYAMDAGLTSALFWGSLASALAVAFVVTLPVNRWLIGRGLGHAAVHGHH